jgi:hypothetical protein
LIGTGADPQRTGKSFYLYYTDSKKGAWSRWSDAKLVRREITLDPVFGSPVISPTNVAQEITPSLSAPSTFDWIKVGDYASDFQAGTPASGWRYAWNPTGKLGNSSAFASLHWSSVAQAYNTTGGATTTPGSKTHHDDYLALGASGGHPGQPTFMPITGYTIQAEDGAGTYRLADTSIRKGDGATSGKEDGLGVFVYVNNKLVGTSQSVSTNGALTSFNRELGQLNVGDTVWVMIDPLKNQLYDSFTDFGFSIQKAAPIVNTLAASSMMFLSTGTAVPEPATAALILLGIAGVASHHRTRRRAETDRGYCRVNFQQA